MAVLVRKPAKAIPFPPTIPPPREHYDYSSGDGWKSIAKDHGFSDPWDVIFYNFQCRNPEEVNWCMQEFLGCTKSKDGKNYSFDSSDPRRRVYIPPVGFKAFSQDALDARQLVLAALQHPSLSVVEFHVGTLKVDQDLFAEVRKHISTRTIVVFTMPPGVPARILAIYRAAENAILVRNPHDRSPARLAVAVHEAVHAGFDVGKAAGKNGDGEACGYVAEALFMMKPLGGPALDAFDPFAAIPEPHRQWAAFIAKRVLLHRRSSKTPYVMSPVDGDYLMLKNLIGALPEHVSTAALDMDNDGV